ncbi:FxsB family cyclophane-forming radical SAM/SPASM peptide maturase [Plantactinospora sp. BB1]|uniref:FxsB family cyclophane-forming radical SAM/SPASM peptide maturase n=1 Tax=Plantactinospora sp. BB1 TaxID=2071627 RepID=UPI000D17A443|nr:FxsB family cyclophane-forming radical SAM/SPASM peptide maturase [Plantactinospora sp. BB1]AVT40606.1 FxsB family radical SAM/SPASM domain protein [Plantactinospora sp. BB1]
MPFREYVVKLRSRCNLACDYCYMYELADQSARSAPAVMNSAVFDRVCERIAEHADTHGLAEVRVVFHGGEPMLAGSALLAQWAGRLREALPERMAAHVAVQTNGVLLTGADLDRLAAAGVRVGVSLDGGRVANDRHRRYRSGRSSFPAADRALRMLRARPELFAGILCVVDVENDPVHTYEALLEYDPPMVDFLLPHAHWDRPPPGWRPGTTRYGDWLVAVFDRQYGAPVQETRVRLFEELIRLSFGAPSRTETVGLSPVATVVFNVDGAYEQVDTLRSTYSGAVGTDLTVFANPLDAAMHHPQVRARQAGAAGLADACRRCAVHLVCGGGYYPHRYRAASGFANPSVYCSDLERLIRHIVARLRSDLTGLRDGTNAHASPG